MNLNEFILNVRNLLISDVYLISDSDEIEEEVDISDVCLLRNGLVASEDEELRLVFGGASEPFSIKVGAKNADWVWENYFQDIAKCPEGVNYYPYPLA